MNDPDQNDRPGGRQGGGDSGGGAYPNPHRGKAPAKDGFTGRGGQSDLGYRGPEETPNAPAGEEDDSRHAPRRSPGPGLTVRETGPRPSPGNERSGAGDFR